jgi:hypothetical protein
MRKLFVVVQKESQARRGASIAATFLALNAVLQTPLKDLNGSVGTKRMTLSTVATTSGRCASRKEATDGSLSDVWKALWL